MVDGLRFSNRCVAIQFGETAERKRGNDGDKQLGLSRVDFRLSLAVARCFGEVLLVGFPSLEENYGILQLAGHWPACGAWKFAKKHFMDS